MTIRFDRLLKQWYPVKDTHQWVLGTIFSTQRSTYRKAGAMMLINDLGQIYGMLSGGCLEGELVSQARKAIMTQKTIVQCYDMREDSDSQWQRGIGCGGEVNIMLQVISAENNYLGLDQLYETLNHHTSTLYWQNISKPGLTPKHWRITPASIALDSKKLLFQDTRTTQTKTIEENGERWLATLMAPAPHLLICGGGMDAQPLAALADTIGWRVSVNDKRVGYADEKNFPHATRIKAPILDLLDTNLHPDAIVIMNHNIELDAHALKYAQRSDACYIGILGPKHRRKKVEAIAQLNESDFKQYYCGPAGIDIGGVLPETIALSILSECHKIVEGKQSVTSTEKPLPNHTETLTKHTSTIDVERMDVENMSVAAVGIEL